MTRRQPPSIQNQWRVLNCVGVISTALIVRELSSSAHVIVSCCPEEGSIMCCSENVLRVMDRMERTNTLSAETHINTQDLFTLS